jgi:2-C-methyl-D-erythritol 4-phosphate cytidylyltransferase
VLVEVGGRAALAFALDAAQAAQTIAQIVVVSGEHTWEATERLLRNGAWSKVAKHLLGGARRQDSVLTGVSATAPDLPIVAVHDGARPFVTPDLFDAVVAEASRHGAAIAAVPLTDTIKRVAEDLVVSTLARDELRAAQTPQAARRELLLEALHAAARMGIAATDEASLLESLGVPIAVVLGSRLNLKLTEPDDALIAEAWFAAGLVGPRP